MGAFANRFVRGDLVCYMTDMRRLVFAVILGRFKDKMYSLYCLDGFNNTAINEESIFPAVQTFGGPVVLLEGERR